jgi:hypothetical protein
LTFGDRRELGDFTVEILLYLNYIFHQGEETFHFNYLLLILESNKTFYKMKYERENHEIGSLTREREKIYNASIKRAGTISGWWWGEKKSHAHFLFVINAPRISDMVAKSSLKNGY